MFALLAAIVLPMTGCAHRNSASQSTLRIAFVSSSGTKWTGAEGWAYQTGAMQRSLKPYGITVIKATGFPGGPEINQLLAGSTVDLAEMGDTPALVGEAVGIPERLINISSGGGRGRARRGGGHASVGSGTAILVLPNGPKTLADLKGKKVGVPRGTNPERFLLGVLDINGLADKVQRVHIPTADGEAALRGGSVDAIVGGQRALTVQHGFRVLAQANDYPQLAGTSVTIASEKFLTAHPNFPTVWNESRKAWVKELIAHPDDYYKFAAAHAKISVSLYRQLYPLQLYTPEPFTPEAIDRLNGTKKFLLKYHFLKRDFTIDEWRYGIKK
jgi:NitT/TauT family transport system substrate-binding protein/sulfonate transport system substrate-binding protein